MHDAQTTAAPRRIDSIQALRGLAVLGVLVFHAQFIEAKYSLGDILLPEAAGFGQSGVDLFFVISGFVMVTVTRGRFGHARQSARFLWARLARIYPTYWFYFLITAAVFVLRPTWVNAAQGHQADLLASFFLLPQEQLPLVMVAWSLVYELWFYVVFGVLLLMSERRLLPALLGWALLLIGVQLAVAPVVAAQWPPGLRIVSSPFALEFIAGALCAAWLGSGRLDRFARPALAAVAVPLLLAGAWASYHWQVFDSPLFVRALVFGALYGALIVCMVLLESAGLMRVPRWARAVGDMSYTLYLSHILVLSAVGRLWLASGWHVDGTVDNALALTVAAGCALVFAALAYRWVEKPLLDASHGIRDRLFGREQADRPATRPVRARASAGTHHA